MSYEPTVWKNGEEPALNAKNLNKIEQELFNLSGRYVHYQTPADFGAVNEDALEDMILKMHVYSRVQFWINLSEYPVVYNEVLSGISELGEPDAFGIVTIRRTPNATRIVFENYSSCRTYMRNHTYVNGLGFSEWCKVI